MQIFFLHYPVALQDVERIRETMITDGGDRGPMNLIAVRI